jgi:hypothetical protein
MRIATRAVRHFAAIRPPRQISVDLVAPSEVALIMQTTRIDLAGRDPRSRAFPVLRTRPRSIAVAALLASTLACGSDPSGPSFTSSGPCDSGLALASSDASHAARSMGICDGLVSAAWVYPDGSAATTGGNFDLGHGLLTSFGANNAPREGVALLALSSGTARAENQQGYSATFDKGYNHALPAGFPKAETSCPAPSGTGYDGIGLRIVLVVPAGVRFLAFDYAYFTRDYPDWVCTSALDQAAALVTGLSGAAGVQNVLLDPVGNPMFASPTSIRACASPTCPLGTAMLDQTGFSGHGSSGWIRTPNLAVTPGDTVRATFAIWDSTDGTYDSSLLLDSFAWIP